MKILLVQTAFLGDVILSAPVIDAIHRKFPDSELTLLTTHAGAEIFKHDPRIKEIIKFDKRGRYSGIFGLIKFSALLRTYQFNQVFSLHKSFRTALLLCLSCIPQRIGIKGSSLSFLYTSLVDVSDKPHQVERNLKLLSVEKTDFKIYPSNDFESGEYLEDFSDYVLIAPGSIWATKRWNWQGFHKVSQYLQSLGYKVLLVGSEAEAELAEKVRADSNAINLAGKISLSDTVKLASAAKLMVVNDSMMLHLSSAFGIPVVAIFCATSPTFGFGPWNNERAIVVEEQGLECKPCARHGSKSCPTGTEACMHVSSEKVIAAINLLMK
jgi:heptosyltransferase-2